MIKFWKKELSGRAGSPKAVARLGLAQIQTYALTYPARHDVDSLSLTRSGSFAVTRS
jgi:hypothetical protein